MLSLLCRAIRLSFVLLTFLLLSGFLAARAARAGADTIQIDVSPPLESVRPLTDLVNIELTVPAQARKPVQVSVQLWAPPRGSFFTTDFPLVEGTKLLEIATRLADGNLNWSYAFPIRGTYRLDLRVVDAAGSVVERRVLLRVTEDWSKWLFLYGFLAVLFAMGVAAGRIFSGRASAQLGLLVVSVGAMALPLARPGVAAEAESRLVVSAPRVGSLATIRWSVPGGSKTRFDGARLAITIAQLEKERTLFRLNGLGIEGDFDFGYQFSDASEHEVTATVALETGEELSRTTERVEVTSPDPFLADRLRPVLGSLLVVIAGLVTGRLSRKHPRRRNTRVS